MEQKNEPFSENPFGEEPFSMNAVPAHDIAFASFGVRMGAYIIDALILMAITWFIWGFDRSYSYSSGGWETSVSLGAGMGRMIFNYGYFFAFWALLSTTPGKMVVGIKIVNAEGQKISAREAGIRTAGYVILIIGMWFILGDERKQALHDRFADTYVIYKS